MEPIQLKLSLSIGIDGVDISQSNPPSRAFSALMASGKNHKAQTFCFLNSSDQTMPLISPRWFGIFLHTTGDRLLFFPGLSSQIDWIEKVKQDSKVEKHALNLNHFSAEPSRKRWHFTANSSNNHLAGGRTPEAGQDSYFWLGLSLQNYESFLPLYKNTYIVHNTPASDAVRRLGLLKQLEESTTYTTVNIDNQEHSKIHPSFIHMCFIFSSPSAPNYAGPEWLPPAGSPHLDQPLPSSIPDVNIRTHRFPLSPSWDIQLATMLLPGIISRSAIFTSPASL